MNGKSTCLPANLISSRRSIPVSSCMNLRQMKMSGLESDQVAYLRRQRDRIDLCLDWLETKATRDGFVPDEFSVMDLNLICALGNVDNHKSFE
jgi:glutathione S-transferase